MMTACDIAAQYVAHIQAGRYEAVGELFADDAIFYNPQGRVLRGRDAIGVFYSAFLGGLRPIVRGVRHVSDEAQRVCVFELESRMSRAEDGSWKSDPDAPFSMSAVDRITINAAGRIEHMIVYTAPNSRWQGEQE
jgi:hypothetical protein